jgi:deoxyribose-phosphate aldolase
MASKNGRNAGMSLDLDWVAAASVNCSAVEQLSPTLPGRRSVKKVWQPVRSDMLAALGVVDQNITVGAVSVYPIRVRDAVEALDGAKIPVASVATGFPAGQTLLAQRIAEIEGAIEDGAAEIDIEMVEAFIQHVMSSYQETTGIKAQVYPSVAADGAGVLDLPQTT